jgi:hypothetical protein
MPKPGTELTDDDIHEHWLEEFWSIRNEFHYLHVAAEVIEELDAELVFTHRPGSGLVVSVLRTLYAEAQAMRVRRLVDATKGVRSLVHLVGDMAGHATELTRDRYRQHYVDHISDPAQAIELADREFDDLAGAGQDHVPRRRLRDVQGQIRSAGDRVKRYADEVVAHTQPDSTATLSWGEFKTAVGDLSDLYTQVGLILTGIHTETVPILQDDWRSVFSAGLFSEPRSD